MGNRAERGGKNLNRRKRRERREEVEANLSRNHLLLSLSPRFLLPFFVPFVSFCSIPVPFFGRAQTIGRLRSHPVGDRCRPFSLWSGRTFGDRASSSSKMTYISVRRASYFFAFLAVFLVDFFVAFFAVFFAAAIEMAPCLCASDSPKQHNSGRIFEECRVQSFVFAKDFRKSSHLQLASKLPWILGRGHSHHCLCVLD